MLLEPRMMYDGAAAATGANAVHQDAHAADAAAHDTGAANQPITPNALPGGAAPPVAVISKPDGPAPLAVTSQPDTPLGHDATDTGAAGHPNAVTPREIVFIDGSVPDLQALVTGAKPGEQVVVLDPAKDGVQQIADYLAASNAHDLTAIQIVSHGLQGEVRLGNTILTDANLTQYAPALAEIGAALAPGGDILLYGCDVAKDAAGHQFLSDFSTYTGGANVAAATHDVGSADQGGNWTLDAATGPIEAGVPFTDAALAGYHGLLINPNLTATQTTTITTDTDGDGDFGPGDTVTTTVTISNSGGDATGVSFNENLNGMTQVPGSTKVTPIAFDDAYSLSGNTPITVSAASGVLANDHVFDGTSSLVVNPSALTAIGVVQSDAVTHGTVVMDANGDGGFTYTPDVGFTGTATFQYTAHDVGENLDSNQTGTVTLTVSNLVWYVDKTAASSGQDGSFNHPFTSFTPFGAGRPDHAGDTIFVYNDGSPGGGITLLNNETFLGNGALFVVNGHTIGSGAQNTSIDDAGGTLLTLGSGNTVRGFTLGNASTDISGSTFGTLTLDTVTINNTTGQALSLNTGAFASGDAFTSITSSGGADNIFLDKVTGSVDLGSGALSGASGDAFKIGDGTANSGSTVAVTYSGAITSSGGDAVTIEDRSGGAGNIALSGNISDSSGSHTGIFMDSNTAGTYTFSGATKSISSGAADGIHLTNDTGATIDFTNGGLTITTTSGTGFLATGGGTIDVTGAGNTINAGSGTALDIDHTAIGASGLIFQSLSAGAGANDGIILDTTGTSAGLTVTGTSTTAGSGGTIQHKTGADGSTTSGIGIYLNSTSNVSLKNMQLNDFDNFAIRGFNVTGFALDHSVISSNIAGGSWNGTNDASGVEESSVSFDNLTGAATISNTSISGGYTDNVRVLNTSGTLNRITFDAVTIGTNQFGAASDGSQDHGNAGISLETTGAAVMNATVQNSTFTASRGDLFHLANNGTGSTDLIFTGNHLSNNYARIATGGGGVTIGSNGTGNLTYNIDSNTFRDSHGAAVLLVESTTSNGISMVGSFTNNTIGVAGVANSGSLEGDGLKAQFVGKLGAGGTGVFKTTIANNTIQQYNNFGIDLQTGGGAGASSGTYEAIVTGNTVGPLGTNTAAAQSQGIAMNGGTNVGDTFQIYLEVGGTGADKNTVNNWTATNNRDDIRLRQRQATTIHLTAKNGAGTTDYAGANNDNAAVVAFIQANNVAAHVSATNTVPTGGGFVGGTPPLLVAPGGIEPAAPPSDGGTPTDTGAGTPGPTATPPSQGGTQPSQPADLNVNNGVLTQAELDAIAQAGIQRWAATGLSADQINYLEHVTYTISDLPGLYLGAATSGAVTVDVNAAGHGWFIDSNPLSDGAFGQNVNGDLFTTPSQAAAGHIDLLTTVMHEMGHELGLGDTYSLSTAASLMYGYIVDGERRLPVAGETAGAVLGQVDGREFAIGPISIGTLPGGKSVSISWQATIDSQSNQLIVNPSNQGAVSGTNFAALNTNTVVTTLDTLTLGNQIFNDQNANGVFDAGDVGIDGVHLTLFADTDHDGGSLDGSDTQVATTVTAGGGLYSFTGLAPGDYLVQVDANNFQAGTGALAATPFLSPNTDTTPNDNIDGDNNGEALAGGIVATRPITLSYNSVHPAGAGDDTNNTLDIGFISDNLKVTGAGTINGIEAASFSGTVATFTDTALPAATAGDFTATINWGDGSTSTGTVVADAGGGFSVNGQHTYAEEGNFTIGVAVTDSKNVTSQANSNATIADAALAANGGLTLSGTEGAALTGTVATFTDANPNATVSDFTATVDWGDGTAASTATVTANGAGGFSVSGAHTYAEEGAYTTTVTIADDGGSTAQASVGATVTDAALTANGGLTLSGTEGAALTGTVATFTDANPIATASDFTATINWGDGSTSSATVSANIAGGFSVSGTHAYAEEGAYATAVSISDVGGSTVQADSTATVTVTDAALNAKSGLTVSGTEGAALNGTVATFTDANPNATVSDFTATINWGDGTAASAATVTANGAGGFSVSGTHAYAEEGAYTTSVSITDVGGSTAQASSSATVADAALAANGGLTLSGTESAALNGTVATFTDANPAATVSDFTATINWGDGSTSTGTVTAGNTGGFSVSGTHVYAEEGAYTTTVTIADDGGSTAQASVGATVADAALTANGGLTLSGTEGAALTGTVATFTDGNPNATAADFLGVIIWGDGSSSSATVTANGAGGFSVSGTHTYAEEGSYAATVTITDDGGSTTQSTSTVTVADAALTATGGLTFNGIEGASPASQVVATFTDANPNATAGDFTATINWGDGTAVSAATVTANGVGGFSVSGTHAYGEEGSYAATVAISDDGGSTAQATSSAIVGGSGKADLTATLTGLNGSNNAVQDTAVSVATATDAGTDVLSGVTYQWQLNGSSIVGASNSSYTPIEADEGKPLAVIVTWSDAGGSESVTVSAGTIQERADLAATLSSQSPVQGSAISVASVSDGGTDVHTNATYQWQANGAPITGATSASYTPSELDEGKTLSVAVTYAGDAAGSESTTVTASNTVADSADLVATLNGLTGSNAVQGTAVSVATATDGGTDVHTSVTYQWQLNGAQIKGATSVSYTPTEADEGKTLSVVITYAGDAAGSESATVSAGSIKDSADLAATLSSQSPVQGTAISVTSVTDATTDVQASATYQWQANGAAINGATGVSYTPTEADEGKTLSVVVTYAGDAAGSESTTVAASSAVADSADTVVTISGLTGGNAVEGTAVSASITDAGLGVTGASYQWQLDGHDISGATGAAFTPTEIDEGHALTVNVAFKDASSPTPPAFTPINEGNALTVNVAGGNAETGTGVAGTVQEIAGGDTVVTLTGLTGGKAVEGTAVGATITDGGLAVTGASYQWQLDGHDISGATGAAFTPTEIDEGHALTVNVAFKDAAGNVETGTAAAGAVQEVAGGDTVVTLTGLTSGKAVESTAVGATITDGGLAVTGASYQWQLDGHDIIGATAATFTPTETDEGHALTVNVLFKDAAGNVETGTAAAGAVQEVAGGDTVVTINGLNDGNARPGDALTASITDGGAAVTAPAYQWQRDGQNISGATSATYTPLAADVGHTLSVNVAFTDIGGNAETGTTKVSVVEPTPFHDHDHGNDHNDDRNDNDRGHSEGFFDRVTDVNGGGGRFFGEAGFVGDGQAVYVVTVDVDATVTADASYDFRVPLLALEAPLNGDVVSVTAQLSDGRPLPSWLHFDSQTGKFAGLAPNEDIMTGSIPPDGGVSGKPGNGQPGIDTSGKLTVELIVRDSKGNMSILTFGIDLSNTPPPNKGGWNLEFNRPVDPWGLGAPRDLAMPVPWGHAAPHQGGHMLDAGKAIHGMPSGRAGLSEQLDSTGWRRMNADRLALLESLRQGAAAWQ
jgi:hypothetical protein